MCEVVLTLLKGEGMNSSLNPTFTVLISKKTNSKFVSVFKSISLYNVLYKVVSKVITNRLKPLMHSIILATQSALIPRRIIMDNILLAHELLHTMKHNSKDIKRNIEMKLDMSKAYD